MKETTPTVLARIEQKLNDFIVVNEKEHQELNISLKDLSQNCNHVHDGLVCRIIDLESQQKTYKAIKEDRKEKTSMFQGKLREISILI